jgi:peptide/nickel transport system permease protein
MKRYIFKQLLQRPLGRACFIMLVIFYFCAIFADFLAPYKTSTQQLEKSYHPPTALTFKDGKVQVKIYRNIDPTAAIYEAIPGQTVPVHFFARGGEYKILGLFPTNIHLFQIAESNTENRIFLMGSDSTGRDVFSRLLIGSRVSLGIGFIGITITLVLGFLIGAFAGYAGGITDNIIMRGVEFLIAIPGLYLLLSLRSALAPHFDSDQMFLVIVILLAFIGWPGTARIIRGMTLSLKQRPFVLAAEAMGQSKYNILTKHILPNLSSYLLVSATLSIPGYILGEAALSFLGLGIQEPSASWGMMLSQAQEMKVFMLNFWWLLIPGFAIFLTVIAFNIIGDELRDIIDPKFRTDIRS